MKPGSRILHCFLESGKTGCPLCSVPLEGLNAPSFCDWSRTAAGILVDGVDNHPRYQQ